MRSFILVLLLTGCAANIQIITIDPDTGITTNITVESARRTAISTPNVTVITGQVLINDETVQVLAKEAATTVKVPKQ